MYLNENVIYYVIKKAEQILRNIKYIINMNNTNTHHGHRFLYSSLGQNGESLCTVIYIFTFKLET